MKTLLIETRLFEGKLNEDSNGRMLVRGVLQRADAENQNGRVYPVEILKREVLNYQKLIKERRALGELDHPDSTVINLKNVSHNIRELYWEDTNLMGVVEILPTPSGNILKELFRAEILLGISSRGMGSTQNIKGNTVVGEDFQLLCWDFVSNPSVNGAFMTPMNESIMKQIGGETCGDWCRAQSLMQEIIMTV